MGAIVLVVTEESSSESVRSDSFAGSFITAARGAAAKMMGGGRHVIGRYGAI